METKIDIEGMRERAGRVTTRERNGGVSYGYEGLLAADVLALCAEVERLRAEETRLLRIQTEEAEAYTDQVKHVARLAAQRDDALAEVERLRGELKSARGAVVGSLRTHRENQTKVGALLLEIADTAIAAGMMAPDMREAIDGPNAIQFMQHIRAWFAEHLGAEERLAFERDEARAEVERLRARLLTFGIPDREPTRTITVT